MLIPPTAAVEPAPGQRLVSVSDEVVGDNPEDLHPNVLPTVELRDAGGGSYASGHGRVALINGASSRSQPSPGGSIQSDALFEVPETATGLRAAFRAPGGGETMSVALD